MEPIECEIRLYENSESSKSELANGIDARSYSYRLIDSNSWSFCVNYAIWAASWQNQQNGMCAQRRGWSESSLGAKVILLVLSSRFVHSYYNWTDLFNITYYLTFQGSGFDSIMVREFDISIFPRYPCQADKVSKNELTCFITGIPYPHGPNQVTVGQHMFS